MQTGVKKRKELHEKYQEKFKELGVSLLYTAALVSVLMFCCAIYSRLNQPRIQKCGLGVDQSSVEGNRMEAPTGVGSGEGAARKFLACSPWKWCILMHSGARFRPNIIATMMFMTSAEV